MSTVSCTTSRASRRRRSSGSSLRGALLAALLASLAASDPAIAQGAGALPDLTQPQREALATGRQRMASYGDPAFDALLENTRSWGQMLFRWAAAPSRVPAPTTPSELATMLGGPDESAGRLVVIFGELLEREPLPKYANVERWLVAPLDPDDRAARPDRAAIIFVDRTTSAAFDLAEPGGFVSVAARFYKPLVLPRRTTGEEVAYPAFVGASFAARQDRAGPTSGLFVYVGLALAFLIAALIILLVLVNRIRSIPARAAAPPRPAEPVPAEHALPSDPARALEHLAARADSADNQSNA